MYNFTAEHLVMNNQSLGILMTGELNLCTLMDLGVFSWREMSTTAFIAHGRMYDKRRSRFGPSLYVLR